MGAAQFRTGESYLTKSRTSINTNRRRQGDGRREEKRNEDHSGESIYCEAGGPGGISDAVEPRRCGMGAGGFERIGQRPPQRGPGTAEGDSRTQGRSSNGQVGAGASTAAACRSEAADDWRDGRVVG